MTIEPDSLGDIEVEHWLSQRYALDRRIAVGGMGEVWIAADTLFKRRVAIKVLKADLAADPTIVERFRREAIALSRVRDPNVVTLHELVEGDLGGRAVTALVTELVDGKNLRQILDERKRLSTTITVHIGLGVARALAALEQAGLVHRDVKPGNILVTADARVILADFGIVTTSAAYGEDLTSPSVMMGTPKYISPEQIRGRRVDSRADQYGLGLVLYECLAGEAPFRSATTDIDTILARLDRDPPDLHVIRPELPSALTDIISRMLARRPEYRFENATDVVDALSNLPDAEPREIEALFSQIDPAIPDDLESMRIEPGGPNSEHLSAIMARRRQTLSRIQASKIQQLIAESRMPPPYSDRKDWKWNRRPSTSRLRRLARATLTALAGG